MISANGGDVETTVIHDLKTRKSNKNIHKHEIKSSQTSTNATLKNEQTVDIPSNPTQ
jgi:hypothetical protein